MSLIRLLKEEINDEESEGLGEVFNIITNKLHSLDIFVYEKLVCCHYP
jgi:hypothetical protein